MLKKLSIGIFSVVFAFLAMFTVAGCDEAVVADVETSTYNIWDGTVQNVPEAVEGVITITTAEQLAGLAQSVKNGEDYEGVTIKLGVDVNLKNRQWTPIGYGDCPYNVALVPDSPNILGPMFKGTFDGQNHTVSNLKVTTFDKGGKQEGAAAGVGLFGQLVFGTVKNVKIKNAEVKANHFVGSLVGYALSSTIENCSVENAKVSCIYANDDNESGDKAGALVGHFAKGTPASSEASITNCSAKNCQVDAYRDAGQVLGCLSNGPTYENLTADNVTVTANHSHDDSKDGQNIRNEVIGRIA